MTLLNPTNVATVQNSLSSIMLEAANSMHETTNVVVRRVNGLWMRKEISLETRDNLINQQAKPLRKLANNLEVHQGSAENFRSWLADLTPEDYALVRDAAPESIRSLF